MDVPILWLPYIQGDAAHPTGPLKDFATGHDGILGYQVFTDWDVFNLLGIEAPLGNSLTLNSDFLSRRGPALGTFYNYTGEDFLGIPGQYNGVFKLYGLRDHGSDILGGGRGGPHPLWRGRLFWDDQRDLPYGFTALTQVSLLSDKNFLEQYYKPEFDTKPNQETFVFLKNSQGTWGSNLLVEPYLRNWVTETAWLPKAEGRILGWSFLDRFTYDARVGAGFAMLQPTQIAPPPLLATDAATSTGRFDLWQELSAPFLLGPLKMVPFGIVDLTGYSSNLAGNPDGRFYGGGGLRASLPLSRLYPDARSELFNINGIYHKMVFSGTYYAAWSSTPYFMLPQLDRLNDDATDQALRDITPRQPVLNPANGVALATNPLFNPQLYAIRRLDTANVDTLDTIQAFQLDWRQRWQTKRGFPGAEHVVDWLTLDLSASLYPMASRDNFGNAIGFVEYDAVWNVGDRTALVSNGWVDPFDTGAHYFTVGAVLNRPGGTNFYIGYHHTDPLQSRVLAANISYAFSEKYSITAASAYDFGQNRGLSHAITFSRMGTDLQFNVSVTYNPILNNWGAGISILPIVMAAPQGIGSNGAFGYGQRTR
jgi:hypothetical protein